MDLLSVNLLNYFKLVAYKKSMNKISLDFRNLKPNGEVKIGGSKSESNRWLILKQLWSSISITNLSDAEDTVLLQKALNSNETSVDINHAGTAMRFLTAFFAVQDGKKVVLTGSERMKNRPIKILVDALKELGAEIEYLEKDGFPPLKIHGKKLIKNTVSIAGNVSSQYLSALLLIAPKLTKGLTLTFTTEVTSIPYLKMTISQLKTLGIDVTWKENTIVVKPVRPEKIKIKEIEIESDWSSASYYFSLIALSKNGKVSINSFFKNSQQGDAALVEIYNNFGVSTLFEGNKMELSKVLNFKYPTEIELDLINTPDIAQTIAVTCLGLGVNCYLTGLHTLKIKETDRLIALKNELEKFGAVVEITENSLQLICPSQLNENILIETYHDHRMAMAFAPLSLLVPLTINDALVVQKSYPKFWDDFKFLFKD